MKGEKDTSSRVLRRKRPVDYRESSESDEGGSSAGEQSLSFVSCVDSGDITTVSDNLDNSAANTTAEDNLDSVDDLDSNLAGDNNLNISDGVFVDSAAANSPTNTVVDSPGNITVISAATSIVESTANTPSDTTNHNFNLLDTVIVDMANPRIPQLTAELETIFFQLGEIAEIIDEELDGMSLSETTEQHTELKQLRVNMVKANQELKLLNVGKENAIDHLARECPLYRIP
jgi:hypothetical protein